MSPSKVSRRIVLDRLAGVDRMLGEFRLLPLVDRASFLADNRNVWAAESCLRRAIEELFDICSRQVGDLARIRGAFNRWMDAHPEMVDTSL
jgi:hypothetical protein